MTEQLVDAPVSLNSEHVLEADATAQPPLTDEEAVIRRWVEMPWKDWLALKEKIEGVRRDKLSVQEPAFYTDHKGGCFRTKLGLEVMMAKDGGMAVHLNLHGQKKPAPNAYLPISEMERLVKHVVKLNRADEKTRYFAKNDKRAFSVGLAMGRAS